MFDVIGRTCETFANLDYEISQSFGSDRVLVHGDYMIVCMLEDLVL